MLRNQPTGRCLNFALSHLKVLQLADAKIYLLTVKTNKAQARK